MCDDEQKLLDEAAKKLLQFDTNIATLLKQLVDCTPDCSDQNDIRTLEITSNNLCYSLERVSQSILKILEDLHSKNQELESLRAFKRNSESALETQNEKIARLEQELSATRHQAVGQIEAVSWTGSIMGAMLWKSCKQHDSVKALIGTDSLRDFLVMSNCVLSSFVARQIEGTLPLPDTDDYKFIVSICGTFTNLAAFPEGRAHLATDADGLAFANNLLHAIERFMMPAGRLLKRMTLTFVYNICLEENGARFVMYDGNRLRSIINCLDLVNSEDILTLAVTLLMKLIKCASEVELKAAIAQQIPRSIIKQIVSINNPQLKETAAYLLELVEFDWITSARKN
ncbi:uncharacterized protein LOC129768734 isoform X2 [Toxorhynchites rutilus septentrionalis]|uniref:uncharacterized protein LOC129768734 isoform X2 n=1 Tax=Toxorhynchites rutilus septentrionalis TaxID=329112 RepID=UPI00247A407F|nr:uncharacterized protein LOC129768734 isoform X2 [Toxorhynchites rutilus septentrionalis]